MIIKWKYNLFANPILDKSFANIESSRASSSGEKRWGLMTQYVWVCLEPGLLNVANPLPKEKREDCAVKIPFNSFLIYSLNWVPRSLRTEMLF